jgi:hypothetical protein
MLPTSQANPFQGRDHQGDWQGIIKKATSPLHARIRALMTSMSFLRGRMASAWGGGGSSPLACLVLYCIALPG